MRRRWMLRAGSLGLLVGCVFLWVASLLFLDYVRYTGREEWVVGVGWGRVVVANWGPAFNPPGWEYVHPRVHDGDVLSTADGPKFLGFQYHSSTPPRGLGWFVRIPLWFPTAAAAGLCWWVWRRTRVDPMPRAFPVEMKT